MSADNGYTIIPHPNGGYALVGYFMSSDEPISVPKGSTRYKTMEDAFKEYVNHPAKYESEYGLIMRPSFGVHHPHTKDCDDTLCKYCKCCQYCEACNCPGKKGCAKSGCGCGE